MEKRDITSELSLKQAGLMLGVDPKTVKRKIEQGQIAAHVNKINGRLVVDRSEIERMLIKVPYIPADISGLSDTSGTVNA